jgi:hypothetical protein
MANNSIRTQTNYRRLTILFSLAFFVGCIFASIIFIKSNFAIKDIEGVKKFIADQTEVERVALKLKQRYGNPDSAEYRKVVESYNLASLASDQYIQAVKIEVKMHKEINQSIASYESHPSGVQKAFDFFIVTGNDMLGMSASGLELVQDASNFVTEILKQILTLKDEEVEKASKSLDSILNNAYMIEYSELSRDNLLKKYSKL